MRIVFMGTPDFAAVCLSRLAGSRHEIAGVFCQPDKPVGRKHELKMPETKLVALENDFPVFQPESLKNGAGLEILKDLSPDVIVVVAYGKILPKDILSFPKYGCINVHASILPKYRGASPIHAAVINGDSETGVTIMRMDEGVDTGDIIKVSKCPIGLNDTTEDMYEKLAPLGADTLLDALDALEKGEATFTKQDENAASKVGLINREMSKIDWNDDALRIHNKIRGLYSWPCTVSTINGKTIKIYSSAYHDNLTSFKPGEVVDSDGKLIVCCGDGKCVELLELQLEGKKRMSASALLNGFRINKGDIFI